MNNITEYHPVDKIKLPKMRNYPSGLPVTAWNPWNDLRKRHDIANLNLTYPFEPIPGKLISLNSILVLQTCIEFFS